MYNAVLNLYHSPLFLIDAAYSGRRYSIELLKNSRKISLTIKAYRIRYF